MKLLVTCPSGLHIEFEGNYAELPHLDRFLEEIARVEAEWLALDRRSGRVAGLPTVEVVAAEDYDREVNDLRDQVQMYEEKAERDWRDFGEMQDARIAADDRVVELEKELARVCKQLDSANDMVERARSLAHRSLVAATPDPPLGEGDAVSSQLEDAFSEAVERRTAELRAALEFYANADNYVGGEVGWWADARGGEHRWCMDFGSIARSALSSPDRPLARTSPRAGGTGRPAHSRDAVLAALRTLGPSKVSTISEHTDLTPKAIEQVLYRQRVNGTVVHNGVRGPGSRWSLVDDTDEAVEPVAPPVIRRQQSPHEGRVIGAQARAAMSAQLAERHGAHHAQALALVAEHGPVSPAWVADQLVKNRRDTIALMRDMAAAGELVETDEGGYYDIPDRDDQEQAVAA